MHDARRGRSGAGVLAALLLSFSLLVAPSPAGALTLDSAKADNPTWVKKATKRLVVITNRKRAAHGVAKVRRAGCAGRWSRDWARHLDRTDRFEHSDLGGLLRACEATFASENIAMISDRVKPGAIIRMWMRSPGHRANLLSTRPSHIGLAIRWDASRRAWVAVQTFVKR